VHIFKNEGKNNMEDVEVNGKTTVKLILRIYDGRVWIGFAWHTMRSPVAN
jgi:hypothetical protein